MWNDLWFRLRSIFNRRARETELRAELAFHLEQQVEKHLRAGASREEAERLARVDFGALARTTEECRDERGTRIFDNTLSDLGYAIRTLRKSPALVAVAIVAVGLSIAVNSAVFTLLDVLILRSLPVHDAGDLVTVYQRISGLTERNIHGDPGLFSYLEYSAYRDHNNVLTGTAAYANATLTLGGNGGRQLLGELVTCNYFDVMTGPLPLGRGFNSDDCRIRGGSPIVVISDSFWRQQFGADPQILGRTIVLNGTKFSVVGVAPANFSGAFIMSAQLWAPISMQEQWIPREKFVDDANLSWLQMIGRLKPSTSMAQARADLTVVALGFDRDHPPRHTALTVDRATLMNIPQGRTAIIGAGGIVLAAVSLVLLIACANLANLLTARAADRQREIAVRLALGAGRRRLVGQLLSESLLLSIAGGAFGLVAAWQTLRLLVPIVVSQLPAELQGIIAVSFTPDLRILVYSVLLSFATGVAFGLLPALQATRIDLNSALKDGSSAAGTGFRRSRTRSALVTIQVSVCLILLISAGLLFRGLQAIRNVDTGLGMKNVTVATFDLERQAYDPAKATAFDRDLRTRLEQEGFEVAFVRPVPLSGNRNATGILPDDQSQSFRDVYVATVSPNYFRLLRISLTRGRGFDEHDPPDANLAVVSESAAQRFWPGQDPIGKGFRSGRNSWQVVGVAKNVRSVNLGEETSFVYFPMRKSDSLTASLVARNSNSSGAEQTIRREAEAIDGAVLVTASPLSKNLKLWQVPSRIFSTLGFVLGIAGLLLAAMGIYGVVAYTVSQRTREVGIRMSLGADKSDILEMILRQTMRPIVAGVIIGILASAAASRLLTSLLFGVSPLDPLVFAGVSLFLIGIAAFATYVPAQRAAKVDPMIALRHE